MKNGQKSSLYGESSLYSEEIPYSELFSRFTIVSIYCTYVSCFTVCAPLNAADTIQKLCMYLTLRLSHKIYKKIYYGADTVFNLSYWLVEYEFKSH